MARPTVRTAAVAQAVRAALVAGNTRMAAAGLAKISYETFRRWIEDDEEFRELVEDAEAEAEVLMVARIQDAAATGTWTAAAWWLERRRNQEWGRKDRLVHQGDREEPIQHQHEVVHEAAELFDQKVMSWLERAAAAEREPAEPGAEEGVGDAEERGAVADGAPDGGPRPIGAPAGAGGTHEAGDARDVR